MFRFAGIEGNAFRCALVQNLVYRGSDSLGVFSQGFRGSQYGYVICISELDRVFPHPEDWGDVKHEEDWRNGGALREPALNVRFWACDSV
ncbi:hypothetical protein SS1G_13539 [Sclerotinia sclerotiorum 1980 UF-70]|uniref:Uncharacterized protein n=1 Tax=Sclerotinia sclerotiorum (strain ATCC 18683 / 1980 / Ss-1) TaxID=665079 RepID=A7F7F9_SCLS1|nr:hypothetical protein SS1G_13539 [Sclerotinia sclerotiorum 1980 UF-70]EDN98680.1 hypothetical protein SS1G_13539 [Sclerotinia sclerotiorum 1980 UF-70]